MTTTVLIRTLPLCALLMALSISLPGARAASLPDAAAPDYMGVQLKSDNFNVQTIRQVHDMGFRVIRRGFYWDAVEKEKGKYTFDKWDEQMAECKKLGMTVIGVLFGNNKMYEDDDLGGIQSEAGRKGFAAFAAACAVHYKDQNVLWEIWNEPNVRTFWRKNGTHNTEPFAEEYSALVNEVAPAMLKAEPDCFVMAGSVSNYWEPSYQWTEFCFKRGVLKSGIRGWSVHPYGVKTPEEFAVGHTRTQELLKKYGAPDMPILDTERGFSLKETAEGWSGGSKDQAAVYQGWNLVRQFMIDQLFGVRVTSWYEYGGKEGFSLTADDSKPAFNAAKTMISQLTGYKFVRRLDSDSPLDYVMLFANSNGEKKLVAWTSPIAGGTPDEAKAHEIKIENVTSFKPVSIDGTQQPATDHLIVSGSPQYLALSANVEPGKVTAMAPLQAEAVKDAAPPVSATDLKLFEAGTDWRFVKNTGEGSIELGKDADGTPLATVNYDFTKSKSNNTPYILASADIKVPEGAKAVTIMARSNIAQPLTFRLVDKTDQTLQYKFRIKGTGAWELIRIPLDRKLEHWGGANDGFAHFPLQSISLSIPRPNADTKTGKLEYSQAGYTGE